MSDTGYLGNPKLPKANNTINWTKEMVDEYIKCSENPVYFAEKYCKIVTIDSGLINIPLYDFQKDIIAAYPTNLKQLLNQSRQSGKTTVVTIIILHYIIFNESKKVAILANKGAQAIEILGRVQLMYENLPDFLKGGVVTWNKGSFELDNGTKVIAAASSSSAIRGQSVSLLYLDEFAFIPQWEDFAASVLPTLSSGKTSRLIASSTPNGLNQFYQYCELAKKKKNGFWYIEVPWSMVPGRDDKWRQKVLEDLNFDEQRFQVEYECEFMGSSGTLLSGSTLKRLLPETPITISNDKFLKVYEKAVDQHTYVLVADVSRGKGLDYSAFHIFNVTQMPYKQVVTYRCNIISPYDYASVIYKIGKAYNNATILVEINDIGGQVPDILFYDYEYENIIFTESAGRAGKKISGGFGRNIDRGIRTTKQVKAVGCSMAKLLIEGNQLKIVDSETIKEFTTFSKKGTSYEAEDNNHDDMVMGVVLFSWLTDQQYFKEMTDINTLSKLREKTDEALEEELLPFGFVNNGLDEDYAQAAADFWKEDKVKKSFDDLYIDDSITNY